jgi:hypothetical protein
MTAKEAHMRWNKWLVGLALAFAALAFPRAAYACPS